MNRQNRIEEVRQADPVSFGHQTEKMPVAIEAPRPALLDDFEAWFVIAVEEGVGYLAIGVFVCQFKRVGTEPLHVDNCNEGVG